MPHVYDKIYLAEQEIKYFNKKCYTQDDKWKTGEQREPVIFQPKVLKQKYLKKRREEKLFCKEKAKKIYKENN